VLPASIVSSTTAGLFVAPTSTSITADATAPTVEITAYPTSNSATSGNAYTTRVWLTFSSNASMSAANGAAALIESNLLYKGPGIGDIQVAAFTSCAQVGSTTTWACDVDRTLTDTVVGGTVYILAGKFFSTASTPVGNAATVVTVANDATAPTLSSATFTQTATGGTQASYGLSLAAGNITVSAKAAGALDGKAGNSGKFAVVVGAQYAGAETCVYSSTTKTLTISAATTSSALAAALACSNSTTASPVVTVAATDGALTGLTAGSNDLVGGADKVTVTLTFSEALSVAAASDLTFSNAVASSTAITAAAATNNGLLTGVITATYTTTGTTQTGLTTVTPSTNIKDLAGNAMTATAKAMTAA
jgi:hypothetical protein